MPFYIHVNDGFQPLGWRRLGPYASREQAEEQAASDRAQHGWDTEIVTGSESDDRLAAAFAAVEGSSNA